MEEVILERITESAEAQGARRPTDGRGKLKRNPRGKKWKKRNVDALKGMVWHQELGWGTVEGVAKYHTGPESHLHDGGVESISYTFAIRRNGQIVLCNDFDRAVWSQGFRGRRGDENAEFMSVMFEGYFHGPGVTEPSAGEPNANQISAALSLWRICKDEWGWDEDDLYGHYHFGKPACPGTTLEELIESIRANAPAPKHDLTDTKGRQRALKTLGFYAGRIDGNWGPRSKGALIRFQEKKGLVPDGIWGPKTEAAMVQALAVGR